MPVIGVTVSRVKLKNNYAALAVGQSYVNALIAAGATPVLIPLGLSQAALHDLLPQLDGLLFTGGGDVHPSRYGGSLIPQVNSIDEDRDRVELHLLEDALAARKPFLGVCRGLQLVNVGLGGTIYEDILAQHPGAIKHDYFAPGFPREHLAHAVRVDPASRLSKLLGETDLQVNSLHHQGIRSLAPDLRAVAHAPDGIIEAFELPGYPFGHAVQWHPENLQVHAPMRRLFAAFVQAASNGS